MNALVKELVLLGGWLAFAAFGYYAVSRLGDFLEQCQAEGETAYDLPGGAGGPEHRGGKPLGHAGGSTPIHRAMQSQFVAWNTRDHRPVILEFVEKLCGQGA